MAGAEVDGVIGGHAPGNLPETGVAVQPYQGVAVALHARASVRVYPAVGETVQVAPLRE